MSARLLKEEAQRRSILCESFGKHLLLMQKNGFAWYTKGSRTSLQSSVGKSIADQKELTKQILKRFDIPTAKYVHVIKPEDIEQVLSLKFPLVMKPVGGHQGEGVIVGINTLEEAKAAFLAQSSSVLFEEMLRGKETRVTCVNFKVVAASFRKPAYVTGNGVNNISQLIEDKNKDPLRSETHDAPLTKIKIDELVLQVLREQNLSLDSIPESGVEIQLRKTANLSTGGEATDVTDEICEENKSIFESIASHCDLNIVGIDVMCDDLSQPLSTQANAGIIEINASPGLRMHHYPSVGKPRDVASAILDMVESTYGI